MNIPDGKNLVDSYYIGKNFILLATDGIWDVMKSEEVHDLVLKLINKTTPSVICQIIINKCLAKSDKELLGCDNMTIILIILK